MRYLKSNLRPCGTYWWIHKNALFTPPRFDDFKIDLPLKFHCDKIVSSRDFLTSKILTGFGVYKIKIIVKELCHRPFKIIVFVLFFDLGTFSFDLRLFGGFQLLDLIIMELKSHMACYNSMPLIGWNNSIQTGEQML